MTKRQAEKPQKGAALLVMLGAMMVGGVSMLLGMANQTGFVSRQNVHNAANLATIQQALIAWGVQHARDNNWSVRLPCPDTDGDGLADASCGNAVDMAIGLVPWRDLGLGPIRDSAGETPWYAVAGRFKRPLMSPVNTGSPGGLTWENGEDAVAVVWSPGGGIADPDQNVTQNRPSSNSADYLEIITNVQGGVTSLTRQSYANDTGLAITQREIMQAAERLPALGKTTTLDPPLRNQILIAVHDAFSAYTGANGNTSYPSPAALGGNGACDNSLLVGHVPVSGTCAPATGAFPTWFITNRWHEVTYYHTTCTSTNCTSPNTISVSTNTQQPAVFFYAGSPRTGQNRTNPTVAAYLEGTENTNGNLIYTIPPAGSNDAVNTSLPGVVINNFDANMTFTSDTLSNATTVASSGSVSSDAIRVDASHGTVTMGMVSNKLGCLWFDRNTFQLDQHTTRIYFRLRSAFVETDTLESSAYGDGITLAIIQTASGVPASDLCGRRSGGNGFAGLDNTRGIALEIDLMPQADERDPIITGTPRRGYNHVAFMFDGDRRHGRDANPSCTSLSSPPGCTYDQVHVNPSWLEDGQNHDLRMEIHTGYSDAGCTTRAAGGRYARLKAWTDCSQCNNMDADLGNAADIEQCYYLPVELLGDPASPSGSSRGVQLGFTVQTCLDNASCTPQELTLSDFHLVTARNP